MLLYFVKIDQKGGFRGSKMPREKGQYNYMTNTAPGSDRVKTVRRRLILDFVPDSAKRKLGPYNVEYSPHEPSTKSREFRRLTPQQHAVVRSQLNMAKRKPLSCSNRDELLRKQRTPAAKKEKIAVGDLVRFAPRKEGRARGLLLGLVISFPDRAGTYVAIDSSVGKHKPRELSDIVVVPSSDMCTA